MSQNSVHVRDENRGTQAADYLPLVSLVSVSLLGALALSSSPHAPFSMTSLMHYFMGLYFLIFSLLKLFDLGHFSDGFAMYDLIAMKWKPYAQIYPFIELFLALALFSFLNPAFTYSLIIIVMIVGAMGVVRALSKGVDIYCPCMGNILKVPLSTVTMVENLLMALMALMLFMFAL